MAVIQFQDVGVTPQTADATLDPTQVGRTFTNEGAPGAITLTLPVQGILGGAFTFTVIAGHALNIAAPAGQTIQLGSAASTTVSSSAPGSTIVLTRIAGNIWAAISAAGNWNTPSVAPAFPVGSIFITVDPTNPATSLGYGTWTAFAAGRVLVALDLSNPAFDTVEETGGALTVAAQGTNSAPTFTGSSAPTSAVSAGTPSGAVSAPTFSGTPGVVPAQAISWPVGVPTFAGALSTVIVNHTHTIQMQGSATPATTGTHIVNSTAVGGSSRTSVSPDQTNNPAGGAASYTPAGTIAWPAGVPTNATVNFTPAGTNSAPTFTGNPLSTHTHTLTATGTVSAPTFTGIPTSVVQPYIVVYMWKRTA